MDHLPAIDEALKTQNPGRSYSHTFPDGTWISIHVADGGEPKPPAKAFTALQKDPLTDLPAAISLGEKNFIKDHRIDTAAKVKAMSLIPSDFTGPVIIDVESPFMKNGALKLWASIEMLRNLALFCRTSRPDVQWGWYGIPTRDYWGIGPTWEANNRKLQAITEVLQILCPTIYDYYGIKPDRDDERYGRIVGLAREMAGPGQEVLPLTHHRYHNSTWNWGYQIIPKQEHVRHMRNALKSGADGIIAWGGDRSNARNAFSKKTGPQSGGSWEFQGDQWDRIRLAFRSEIGVDDPSHEEIDTYLFDTLYPIIHQRVLETIANDQ